MADRVGQQLGNYRLTQLLGQGDRATVYVGKHVQIQTQAAIKVFQARLAEKDSERFHLEVRIIAHLRQPHIVRVLEFGVAEQTPYLVMDFAPHGTLRQRYARGSRLPIDVVVSYVNQIASALQYAHAQKLIHRNIKPENLLMGEADEILLGDFEIALMAQDSRYQSAQWMAGTMPYMAPELVAGTPHPASDQYSLGIVVYEWLTGERPFQGSLTEIADKHRFMAPAPLREKFPDLAPAVEAVVLKALAKDWTQRFASIQAFAAALEEASTLENIPTLYSFPVPSPVSSPVPSPVSSVASSQSSVAYDVESIVSADAKRVEQPTPKASRGLSRRAVVAGLVGVAALGAVGGGIVWFSRRTASLVSTHSGTIPSPAPAKLPANSPMFGFNAQHTRFNANEYMLSPANVARLASYWSTLTGDLIDSTPAVVGNVVYVGSHDSKVYAFDVASGKILWSATTGSAITSSPAVVNGVVYIGSADHTLYALKAGSGETLWTARADDAFVSSPTVVNGAVYIGSVDHKLYALYAATGTILWTVTTSDSITASPSVIDGVVYVGSNDHTLYACDDFTGTVLWTASTGGSILADSALANGMAYVGSADHSLYALDASTGKTNWTVSTGDRIAFGCAVANGVVYFGADDHHLYACNATTGKVLWTVAAGGRVASAPMVANGVVYFSADDHHLYACNATTGKVLWTTPAGDRITSAPIVVNGVVYAGSFDHKLYAWK